MRWMVQDIAWKERSKGKRVRIGYGRVQIEGKWWKWDEEEKEKLKSEERVEWIDRGDNKNTEAMEEG